MTGYGLVEEASRKFLALLSLMISRSSLVVELWFRRNDGVGVGVFEVP